MKWEHLCSETIRGKIEILYIKKERLTKEKCRKLKWTENGWKSARIAETSGTGTRSATVGKCLATIIMIMLRRTAGMTVTPIERADAESFLNKQFFNWEIWIELKNCLFVHLSSFFSNWIAITLSQLRPPPPPPLGGGRLVVVVDMRLPIRLFFFFAWRFARPDTHASRYPLRRLEYRAT